VAVVENGVLRLAINPVRRGWACAEIQSRRSFGYGRYTFVVNSDLSQLDPWVVLGLFTYADELRSPHNEIDIEVAKWGVAGTQTNAQFAQQPFRSHGHLRRLTLPPRPPYTLWWEWTEGKIVWGVNDGTGALVSERRGHTKFKPAGELVHLNLWLSEGHAPAGPVSIDIASFTHTKL
jgi:hypothetical protein